MEPHYPPTMPDGWGNETPAPTPTTETQWGSEATWGSEAPAPQQQSELAQTGPTVATADLVVWALVMLVVGALLVAARRARSRPSG